MIGQDQNRMDAMVLRLGTGPSETHMSVSCLAMPQGQDLSDDGNGDLLWSPAAQVQAHRAVDGFKVCCVP